MLADRVLLTVSLLPCLAQFALAQVPQDYPVCDQIARIGEVPGNPFVADLVESAWQNLPDGARQPISWSDGKGIPMPASPNPQVVGIVARDNDGRVVIRRITTNTSWHQDGTSMKNVKMSRVWSESICDPASSRVTLIQCASLSSRVDHAFEPYAGDPALSAGCKSGNELPANLVAARVHTTTALINQPRKGECAPSQGPSASTAVPANCLHPGVQQSVVSEQLVALLDKVEWLRYPYTELEIKLTHIRHIAPSPNLFKMPRGIDGPPRWPIHAEDEQDPRYVPSLEPPQIAIPH